VTNRHIFWSSGARDDVNRDPSINDGQAASTTDRLRQGKQQQQFFPRTGLKLSGVQQKYYCCS